MLISRYPPDMGGMEIQCQRLSRALVARGHLVTVLTESPADLPSESDDDGVQVIRYRTRGKPPWSSLWTAMRMLLRLLKDSSFDIYHAHMMATPALLALSVGWFFRKPVLVKAAGTGYTGDIGTSQRLRRGQLKMAWFKKNVQKLVCPSEESVTEFIQMGIPQDRILQIANGVDTDHFHPPAEEERLNARRALNIPTDRLVAIYAGRWVEGKGVEKILEIWSQAREVPSFRWDLMLLIAGGEKIAEERHHLWQPLGETVHMFHNVNDPLMYYQASDLAILLSDAEGLSNFLLESMACGLPSLTTSNAAISKQEDRNGWSWVVESTQESLTRLGQLQNDPSALGRKGPKARQLVETRFSIDRIAQNYENVYHSMHTKG